MKNGCVESAGGQKQVMIYDVYDDKKLLQYRRLNVLSVVNTEFRELCQNII